MDALSAPSVDPHRAGARLDLDRAAASLYTGSDRASVLRGLLSSTSALVGGVAGSISMLSSDGARYVKLAERGASCSVGRSFPVDEGATGQVVARRRPVVLDSYQQIPHGHLDSGSAATAGAVVAIPLWWRGELVGANVLFAGAARRFTVAEIDDLERLTQLAVPGLAPDSPGDATLAQLIRERSRSAGGPPASAAAELDPAGSTVRVDTVVTEVGRPRQVSASVAQVALDLIDLAERAAFARPGSSELHVAVVHRAGGLRLLVHDAHAAPIRPGVPGAGRASDAPTWQELLDTGPNGVRLEHVPGWGTLLSADLPYSDAQPASVATDSPLTARERQVLWLLAEGVGDKTIGRRLNISPRTVEKHVGAVLRKTATASRTAAVVHALDRHWLVGPAASAPAAHPAPANERQG